MLMRWIAVLALFLLACTGCYRAEAEEWKVKYLKEVKSHHKTEQVKNVDIAKLRLELDDQDVLIQNLQKRIRELQEELKKAQKGSD